MPDDAQGAFLSGRRCWAAASREFFKKELRPFIADFAALAREPGMREVGNAPWTFALDFDLGKENPYDGPARNFNALEYRKAHSAQGQPMIDPWPHYLASLKRRK